MTRHEFFEKNKVNPVFFVEKVLKHRTWSKQREILNSVRDNRRTTVVACHGSSKSFSAAEAALWWFKTKHPALIVVTAPTFRQVEQILMKELKDAYGKSSFIGNDLLLQTEIRWRNSDGTVHAKARIVGVTADNPAAFEGFHGQNVLLIVDEAKGVENNLWASFDGIMTSQNSKMLVICTGGPDSTMYAKTFTTNRSLYNCIVIDSFSTPYFPRSIKRSDYETHDLFAEATYQKWKTDSDLMKQGLEYDHNDYEWPLELMDKNGLATPEYEMGLRVQNGSDSIVYRQKVFAENCETSEQQLLTVSELMAVWAQEAKNLPDKAHPHYPSPTKGNDCLGVDVGFAVDKSCVVRRQGNTITDIDIIEGSDTTKLSFFITEKYKERNLQTNVDANGIGKGTYDDLKAMGQNVSAIYGAEKPASNKFVNLRAELYWQFRDAVRNKEIWFLVSKAMMDIVVEEFVSVNFSIDTMGRIKMASKLEIKRDLGRSPDTADAVIYSIAKQSVNYELLKKRKAEYESKIEFNDMGRI